MDFPILSHGCFRCLTACSMKPLALCWLRKLDHHWDLRWTTLLGRWKNVGFLWIQGTQNPISLCWFSLWNSHSWGMPDTPIFYHDCGISWVSFYIPCVWEVMSLYTMDNWIVSPTMSGVCNIIPWLFSACDACDAHPSMFNSTKYCRMVLKWKTKKNLHQWVWV